MGLWNRKCHNPSTADYHAIIHNPVTTEQEYYNQWYYVTITVERSFRMAAYHRLDFAVQFHKEKEHYKRTVDWVFTMYITEGILSFTISGAPAISPARRRKC
jgi:hypothetical protein